MFTIQSVMLALLGFLVANLLVLLMAPAYWRRAVRLTTSRLKQSMPLTEAEIRADKDRLRAEYAIKVYRLEAKAEQSAHDSARQQIELNRRDATISALEGEIGRLESALEEHENAHRVLEQTITDRMPRLEQRLAETSKALTQRERENATLTDTATRQAKALEESVQVNAHQRNEMMRLNSSLAAISARTREGLADPKFDAEVALRTELETARGKLREQAALIDRLQSGAGAPVSSGQAGHGQAAARASSTGAGIRSAAEESVDAEKALALARSEAEAAQNAKLEVDTQLTAARRMIEDQAVEIASMKAALAAYERGSGDERSISLKDSRLAMKVRIGALQAESDKQSAAIQRMRGELAAANEKLAKQAAHFMAEMRRLGTSSGLSTASAKAAGEQSLASSRDAERRSLAPKLAALTRPLRAVAAGVADGGEAEAQDPSRVRGFLKALGGATAVRAGAAASPNGIVAALGADHLAATTVVGETRTEPPVDGAAAPKRRLSDRLTSINET